MDRNLVNMVLWVHCPKIFQKDLFNFFFWMFEYLIHSINTFALYFLIEWYSRNKTKLTSVVQNIFSWFNNWSKACIVVVYHLWDNRSKIYYNLVFHKVYSILNEYSKIWVTLSILIGHNVSFPLWNQLIFSYFYFKSMSYLWLSIYHWISTEYLYFSSLSILDLFYSPRSW